MGGNLSEDSCGITRCGRFCEAEAPRSMYKYRQISSPLSSRHGHPSERAICVRAGRLPTAGAEQRAHTDKGMHSNTLSTPS
eukprot:6143114-Pyramimonas_sp.AAC.1